MTIFIHKLQAWKSSTFVLSKGTAYHNGGSETQFSKSCSVAQGSYGIRNPNTIPRVTRPIV